MSTATKNATEEWVSKERAAGLLNVEPRQVEKRAQQGFIEKQYLPRKPTERAARVQYKTADIEALLAGTPNMYGEPMKDEQWSPRPARELVVMPAPSAPPAIALAEVDFFGAMALQLARLSAAFPTPPITKAWLTVDEAAEYSGLPVPEVERLVEEGIVYAPVGRGRKTWRIQRASLDAYGERAHQ